MECIDLTVTEVVVKLHQFYLIVLVLHLLYQHNFTWGGNCSLGIGLMSDGSVGKARALEA